MEQPLDNQEFEHYKQAEIKYAGFWIRLGALLLDGLILSPLTAGGIMYNALFWKSTPVLVLVTVLRLMYKPLLEFYMGATLGKRIVGISVINEQGEKPSILEALLRNVFSLVIGIATLIFETFIYQTTAFMNANNLIEYSKVLSNPDFINRINGIYGFVLLSDLIMLLTSHDKRTLHDRIGNTYVVYNS